MTVNLKEHYICIKFNFKLDVHGSVHHNINLKERTNKMQMCSRFIIPMFLNCSTCFGRHTAHHQELKNCNCSLWFYIHFWLPAAAMAHWNNKFHYTVASCWFFLWDLTSNSMGNTWNAQNSLQWEYHGDNTDFCMVFSIQMCRQAHKWIWTFISSLQRHLYRWLFGVQVHTKQSSIQSDIYQMSYWYN
jgi:hypothetical protein